MEDQEGRKGSRGHMRVSGQIRFRVYIALNCHQCVHLQPSRSCSSCTGDEQRLNRRSSRTSTVAQGQG